MKYKIKYLLNNKIFIYNNDRQNIKSMDFLISKAASFLNIKIYFYNEFYIEFTIYCHTFKSHLEVRHLSNLF